MNSLFRSPVSTTRKATPTEGSKGKTARTGAEKSFLHQLCDFPWAGGAEQWQGPEVFPVTRGLPLVHMKFPSQVVSLGCSSERTWLLSHCPLDAPRSNTVTHDFASQIVFLPILCQCHDCAAQDPGEVHEHGSQGERRRFLVAKNELIATGCVVELVAS